MTVIASEAVLRLAETVLMPCFDGATAPGWVRARLARSLGSVCLFGRNIVDDAQVRALTDSLRAENPDAVIAIDEEAGDVTRLDAATGSPYPGNAALGRADDVALTRAVGAEVGARLARVGVTVNFAPCADVALDPSNPVIGARSFGADPLLVSRHTSAFIAGHQAAGVAACVKHYPGHGGTDADTHRRLAVLVDDLPQLWENAMPPFAAAIDAGVDAVMAGHLLAPAVDALPASISRRWLTDILRGDMGFTGVIITDALEMQALADTYGLAESAVAALVAGADLLCLGGESRFEGELDSIVAAIVGAVDDGRLPIDRLADAADRVTELGRRTRPDATTPASRPYQPGSTVSAQVAGRAVQVAGPLPPWRAPALVLRCADRPNIAVGEVPWGPAAVDPTLTEVTVDPHGPLPADRIAAAGSVVVVTRDRHRQPWMTERLQQVRALRADAVLLEMGTTGVGEPDAPAVASYGATPANARAALAALGASGAHRDPPG